MPPNNQQPEQNPYGFIMDSPAKAPKKPLVDGTSMTTRIAVVAGGVVILIIIAVVVSQFLGSGQKAQTQRMIDVVAEQTEIIRVSALAEKEINSSSTLNYAKTTEISVQSSQTALSSQLAKRGVSEKQLNKIRAKSKNSKTDTALESAKSSNKYDEAYLEIINASLANYQKYLLAAAGGATANEKEILRTAFEGVTTLKKNDLSSSSSAIKNIVIDKSKPSNSSSSIIDNDVGAPTED